jgi:hypothetical protein
MTRARAPLPSADSGPMLDGELREFVRGGVSIGIATRDAALRSHMARAVGCRHDGGRIVVLLPRLQAVEVLADVEANGRVAVVFTEPSTHRTYQIKGRDAVVAPGGPDDRDQALAYRDALAANLASVGWPPRYTAALLEGVDDELVGIAFTPDGVFIGTPGPHAGDPLAARR